MLEAVKDPKVVKLDVRDVDEWIGASSSQYGCSISCPRKRMHLGARWLEWYRTTMQAGQDRAGLQEQGGDSGGVPDSWDYPGDTGDPVLL